MSDYEYDSDDSQLEEEAVGVSNELVQPAGEEDPEGFHYQVPWTQAKMSYD